MIEAVAFCGDEIVKMYSLFNSGFEIINLDASHSLKFVQVSSEQEMIESSVWYVKLFGQIHFFRPINISSTVF